MNLLRSVWSKYVALHRRFLGLFGLQPVAFRDALDQAKQELKSLPKLDGFAEKIAAENERRKRAKAKKRTTTPVVLPLATSPKLQQWKGKEARRADARAVGSIVKAAPLPDDWEEIDDYLDDDGKPLVVADANGRPKTKSGAIAQFKYLNSQGVDRDICLTDWQISGVYIEGIGNHGDEITCRLDRVLNWKFYA